MKKLLISLLATFMVMTTLVASISAEEKESETKDSTQTLYVVNLTPVEQAHRGFMNLDGSGSYIREQPSLSSKALVLKSRYSSYQIKSYLDQSVQQSSACSFSSGYSSENGCRWVEAYDQNSGTRGYALYDPSAMYIGGDTNGHAKMYISAYGSNIRSETPTGEVIATAKPGQTYVVHYFDYTQAYGYHYCHVEFNYQWGVAQYDPELMHPLDIPYYAK